MVSLDIKSPASKPTVSEAFFEQALAKELGADKLFRVTIPSFLDAYNFDVRACWFGAGMTRPLELDTLVRLYDPK